MCTVSVECSTVSSVVVVCTVSVECSTVSSVVVMCTVSVECSTMSCVQVTGHYVSVSLLERIGLGALCDQLLELVRRVRQLRLDANEYICLKYIILLNSGIYCHCCHHQNEEVGTNCFVTRSYRVFS